MPNGHVRCAPQKIPGAVAGQGIYGVEYSGYPIAVPYTRGPYSQLTESHCAPDRGRRRPHRNKIIVKSVIYCYRVSMGYLAPASRTRRVRLLCRRSGGMCPGFACWPCITPLVMPKPVRSLAPAVQAPRHGYHAGSPVQRYDRPGRGDPGWLCLSGNTCPAAVDDDQVPGAGQGARHRPGCRAGSRPWFCRIQRGRCAGCCRVQGANGGAGWRKRKSPADAGLLLAGRHCYLREPGPLISRPLLM